MGGRAITSRHRWPSPGSVKERRMAQSTQPDENERGNITQGEAGGRRRKRRGGLQEMRKRK